MNIKGKVLFNLTVVLLLAVALISLNFYIQDSVNQKVIKVKKGQPAPQVPVSKNVEIKNRSYVIIPKEGLITSVKLKKGQVVKTGQELLRLNNWPLYAMKGKVVLSRILTRDSVSEDVWALQENLQKFGYYTGTLDGKFGIQTEEAVKLFQSKRNLTPTGVIGPETIQFFPLPLIVSRIDFKEGEKINPGNSIELVDKLPASKVDIGVNDKIKKELKTPKLVIPGTSNQKIIYAYIALAAILLLVILLVSWHFYSKRQAKPKNKAWGILFNQIDGLSEELSKIRKNLTSHYQRSTALTRSRNNLQSALVEIFNFVDRLEKNGTLEAIQARLLQVMERNDIKRWEPKPGEPAPTGCEKFPVETDEYPDGTVVSLVEPGFKTSDGEIIEPATVRVAIKTQNVPAPVVEPN